MARADDEGREDAQIFYVQQERMEEGDVSYELEEQNPIRADTIKKKVYNTKDISNIAFATIILDCGRMLRL